MPSGVLRSLRPTSSGCYRTRAGCSANVWKDRIKARTLFALKTKISPTASDDWLLNMIGQPAIRGSVGFLLTLFLSAALQVILQLIL